MPDDPNWRDNIREGYRESRARNKRRHTAFGRDLRPLQMEATIKFVRHIDNAARTLGVNRSTFIRRAAAVVAAAVTNTSVYTILYESPRQGAYGEQRARFKEGGARDDGEGIEKWCPHPGCDGAHLRR